jgi:hypothetical protein
MEHTHAKGFIGVKNTAGNFNVGMLLLDVAKKKFGAVEKN